jgi:hypothetical protein
VRESGAARALAIRSAPGAVQLGAQPWVSVIAVAEVADDVISGVAGDASSAVIVA